MKAIWLLCGFSLLLPGLASEEMNLRATGEVRFFSQDRERLPSYWRPLQNAVTTQAPKGVHLPTGLSTKRVFGNLKLGRPAKAIPFVIDLEHNRLYIDLNRNNDLSDDQPIGGVYGGEGYYGGIAYGPFRLLVPNGNQLVPRYWSLQYIAPSRYNNRSQVYIQAEDYRLFRININGKESTFAILDQNGDGLFDTRASSEWDGDMYFCNGEREEQRPLPKYCVLEDQVYEFSVAADGSALELKASDMAMGTLTVSPGEVSLSLTGKRIGWWKAESKEGKIRLPADEYNLQQWTCTLRDQQGRKWQIRGGNWQGKSPLTIEAKAEKAWKAPDRLLASVRLDQQKGDELSLSLVLRTPDKQEIFDILCNGQRPPEPRVRIRDLSGRVVKVEKFHYG